MIIKVLRTIARDQGNWNPESFNKNNPTISIPNLLSKLNCIIEWKFCKWPLKLDSETDRDEKYLGDTPELKPGDAFSLGGQGNLQVIRIISEDTIGLEHSETGGLSLKRIWKEKISSEIDLLFNPPSSLDQITLEDVDVMEIPETYTLNYQIPYYLYDLWRERCLFGRDWLKENRCLKLVNKTDLLVYPITCYLTGYKILFNPSDVEDMGDELTSLLFKEIMGWFYYNYERIGVEPETMPEQEEMKVMLENLGLSSTSTSCVIQSSPAIPIVTQSMNNSSDEELNEDFGEFNPNEIYHYSVTKEEGELILYLVKKSFWDSEGCIESDHLDPRFENMYIPEFGSACEGTYNVPDKFKTVEDVYSHLSSIPVFEFNQEFDDFIQENI